MPLHYSCLMLRSDGGWPVDGCYAGSPAEEAGILSGDHIREIGRCHVLPESCQTLSWEDSSLSVKQI